MVSGTGRQATGHQIGDEALVERARAGDRPAFEQLVRRHADRLYAVLLRYTGSREEAEEATQEAFVRAWRRIDGFRGHSQFFTWLYRIGINEAKRRAERRPGAGRVADGEQGEIEAIVDARPGPRQRVEQAELQGVLERAILDLPEPYRLPLLLRDVEGMSTGEAAAVMELGEAAFKSRLHRARMAVRQEVDRYLSGGEPDTPGEGS